MAMVKRANNNNSNKAIVPYGPILKTLGPLAANKAVEYAPVVINGVTKLTKSARRLLGKGNENITFTSGAFPGSVSAPVAISRRIAGMQPRFKQVAGSIHITHRELVTSILPSGDMLVNNGVTAVGAYRINPGNATLFTWLPTLGLNFDMYKFTKIRFHYVPTCATTSTGRVALVWDKDSQDPLPVDRSALSAYTHSAESAPWADNMLVIPCDNIKRFINDGNATDKKLVDFGQLFFATYSSSGSVPLGDIYVEYGVEFTEAQPAASQVQYFERTLAAGLTGLFTRGANYVSDVDVETPNNTSCEINVNVPGTFLFTLVINATTVTNISIGGNSTPRGSILGAGTTTGVFTGVIASSGVPNSVGSITVNGLVGLTRLRCTITRATSEVAYLA